MSSQMRIVEYGRHALVAATANGVALAFEYSDESFGRSGDNLVISTPDGSTAVLENFFVVSEGGDLPVFTLPDGNAVPGKEFLDSLNPPIDTGTSPSTGEGASPTESGGLNAYDDSGGGLLDGVDRYGSLGTDYWTRSTSKPDLVAGTPLRGVGSSPATRSAAQDDPGTTPPTPPGPQTLVYNARAVMYTKDNNSNDPADYKILLKGLTVTDLGKCTWVGRDSDYASYFTIEMEGDTPCLLLTQTGLDMLTAMSDDLNRYGYLRVAAQGKTCTIQVIINLNDTIHSYDEDQVGEDVCAANLEGGGLIHGEWHQGVDFTGGDNRVHSSGLGDRVIYTNGVEAAAGQSNTINTHTITGRHATVDIGSETSVFALRGNAGGINTIDGDTQGGTTDVTLTAEEWGMDAWDGGNLIQNVNAVDIYVAGAEDGMKTYGMSAYDGENAIRNAGAVRIDVESTGKEGKAYGMSSTYGGGNVILDADAVQIDAESAGKNGRAYGMSAYSEDGAAENRIHHTSSLSIHSASTAATGNGKAVGIVTEAWSYDGSTEAEAITDISVGEMEVTATSKRGDARGIHTVTQDAHSAAITGIEVDNTLSITAAGGGSAFGVLTESCWENDASLSMKAKTVLTAGDILVKADGGGWEAGGVIARGSERGSQSDVDTDTGIKLEADSVTVTVGGNSQDWGNWNGRADDARAVEARHHAGVEINTGRLDLYAAGNYKAYGIQSFGTGDLPNDASKDYKYGAQVTGTDGGDIFNVVVHALGEYEYNGYHGKSLPNGTAQGIASTIVGRVDINGGAGHDVLNVEAHTHGPALAYAMRAGVEEAVNYGHGACDPYDGDGKLNCVNTISGVEQVKLTATSSEGSVYGMSAVSDGGAGNVVRNVITAGASTEDLSVELTTNTIDNVKTISAGMMAFRNASNEILLAGGDDSVSIRATSSGTIWRNGQEELQSAHEAYGLLAQENGAENIIDTGAGNDLVEISAGGGVRAAAVYAEAGGSNTIRAVDGEVRIKGFSADHTGGAELVAGARIEASRNTVEARQVFIEAVGEKGNAYYSGSVYGLYASDRYAAIPNTHDHYHAAVGIYAQGSVNTVTAGTGGATLSVACDNDGSIGMDAGDGGLNKLTGGNKITFGINGYFEAEAMKAVGAGSQNIMEAVGDADFNITSVRAAGTAMNAAAGGTNELTAGGKVDVRLDTMGVACGMQAKGANSANTLRAGDDVTFTLDAASGSYGLYAEDGGENTLETDGNLKLTNETSLTDASMWGMYAAAKGKNVVDAKESAEIAVTGGIRSVGIRTESDGENTLTAAGNVTITVQGGSSSTTHAPETHRVIGVYTRAGEKGTTTDPTLAQTIVTAGGTLSISVANTDDNMRMTCGVLTDSAANGGELAMKARTILEADRIVINAEGGNAGTEVRGLAARRDGSSSDKYTNVHIAVDAESSLSIGAGRAAGTTAEMSNDWSKLSESAYAVEASGYAGVDIKTGDLDLYAAGKKAYGISSYANGGYPVGDSTLTGKGYAYGAHIAAGAGDDTLVVTAHSSVGEAVGISSSDIAMVTIDGGGGRDSLSITAHAHGSGAGSRAYAMQAGVSGAVEFVHKTGTMAGLYSQNIISNVEDVSLVARSDNAGAYGMQAISGGSSQTLVTNEVISLQEALNARVEAHANSTSGYGVGMSAARIASNKITSGAGNDSISITGTNVRGEAYGMQAQLASGVNIINTGAGDDTVRVRAEGGAKVAGMYSELEGRNEIIAREGTVTIEALSKNASGNASYANSTGGESVNIVDADRVSIDAESLGNGVAYGMYSSNHFKNLSGHEGTARTMFADHGRNVLKVGTAAKLHAESAVGDAYAMNAIDAGTNVIEGTSTGGIEVRITVAAGAGKTAYAMYAQGANSVNRITGAGDTDGHDVVRIQGDIKAESGGRNVIATGTGESLIELDGKVFQGGLTIEAHGTHDVLILKAANIAEFNGRFQSWLTALGDIVNMDDVLVLLDTYPDGWNGTLAGLGSDLDWLAGIFGGRADVLTHDEYNALYAEHDAQPFGLFSALAEDAEDGAHAGMLSALSDGDEADAAHLDSLHAAAHDGDSAGLFAQTEDTGIPGWTPDAGSDTAALHSNTNASAGALSGNGFEHLASELEGHDSGAVEELLDQAIDSGAVPGVRGTDGLSEHNDTASETAASNLALFELPAAPGSGEILGADAQASAEEEQLLLYIQGLSVTS